MTVNGYRASAYRAVITTWIAACPFLLCNISVCLQKQMYPADRNMLELWDERGERRITVCVATNNLDSTSPGVIDDKLPYLNQVASLLIFFCLINNTYMFYVQHPTCYNLWSASLDRMSVSGLNLNVSCVHICGCVCVALNNNKLNS